MDHLRRKTIRWMISVHTIILDEADEMLNMGFREDIETILRISSGRSVRRFFFPRRCRKQILDITKSIQKDALTVKVVKKELTVTKY